MGLTVFKRCHRIPNSEILFTAAKNVFRIWIAI